MLVHTELFPRRRIIRCGKGRRQDLDHPACYPGRRARTATGHADDGPARVCVGGGWCVRRLGEGQLRPGRAVPRRLHTGATRAPQVTL